MNILILHGAHGGPDTNWFPWLQDRLTNAGHQVAVPQFPTPEGQSLTEWLKVAKAVVDWLPSETILVGHSLGVTMALRLAEQAQDSYVGGFLVAGFFGELGLPDYDPINASFFEHGLDWAKVTTNLGHVHCFAGEKDPYVPLQRSREVADKLGGKFSVIADGGHLNSESGYTRFDELEDSLQEFLGRSPTGNSGFQ